MEWICDIMYIITVGSVVYNINYMCIFSSNPVRHVVMTPNDMDQNQQQANQGNTQDYNGYAYGQQSSQFQQRQAAAQR